MTNSRDPDYQLRREINKRAWEEAAEQAKFHYDIRRAELLTEAGLPPHHPVPFSPQQRARDQRTRKFLEFIKSLLADDTIVGNDDFLDAIEPFLRHPTTTNRIALTIVLRENKNWLGDRLAEFRKFA